MVTQSSIKTFTLLLIFLFSALHNAQAAIPQSINYQGYLTDPSGVALDGSFSIEFNIYNVSAGGLALWTGTQSVAISKGLFSIELGGGTFPLNLFDIPLWLGINVAADGEMSPRSALTSVSFAFKADDADTVGGISAASLDQSAHLIDFTNPHNVSAAQIGSISQEDADATFASQLLQINNLSMRVTSLESITGTASCASGDIISCYSGPAETLNVGNCTSGNKFCSGSTFGACTSQVLPATEICDGQDNNCDGFADETFKLNTDLLNCGSCNNNCNASAWPNVSSYLCQSANCAIETCSAGFFNTDGIANNGCESTCATSGADLPEATFFDNNCDGIDGDIALSFFVSPSGNNANAGTMEAPFLTIQAGIDAAKAHVIRKHVLVAAGSYPESLLLADGVSLFGQYNPTDWMRSIANITTIQSPIAVGILVSNYTVTGYIEGFSIQAAAGSAAGESSRAVILENILASFYLRHNTLVANNGSNGKNGLTGTSGASGFNGSSGVVGCESCNANSSGFGLGGAGGNSSCTNRGGSGGRGGYNNGSGLGGQSANTSGGIGGLSSACFAGGNPGSNGLNSTAPGVIGPNGALPIKQNRGLISGVNWLTLSGNAGRNGASGNSAGGGGGGGGGESNVFCNADRGGGGGGGGGAGCGGGGGSGGNGAGGSIGVLAINADSAIVTDNSLTTGNGGNGGNGGAGGNSGSGGVGGSGGQGRDDSGPGGRGGNGSAGGQGGGGSGGAGGISAGILRSNSAGLINLNNTFLLGTSGSRGNGGLPNGTAGFPGIVARPDFSL